MASRQDLRLWIEQRRAAADREADLLVDAPPDPEAALERGLGLIAFAASLHGWPLPEPPGKHREDQRVYECWRRLRGARP